MHGKMHGHQDGKKENGYGVDKEEGTVKMVVK